MSSVACPALQYFSTLSHKWQAFHEELLNINCVFWFSPQRFSEIFLTLRRTERKIKTSYSCQIAITFEFSWQIFEKYSNIKFQENSPNGSRIVPCGMKDGQTRRSEQSLFEILPTRLERKPFKLKFTFINPQNNRKTRHASYISIAYKQVH